MTDRLQLDTPDGETLEARWDSPSQAHSTVIFCHPHPLQAGSMMAPLMIAVTTRLVEMGFRVLRFNFRGTGASTGSHGAGEAEQYDIDGAMAEATETGLPTSLAGWSFGAETALRWMASREVSLPYAGIAPPSDLLPNKLPPGPKRIVVGTRDQVINLEALRLYAIEHSIDLLLTPGDHFFHGRGKKIGELIGQCLLPAD